MTDTPSQPDVPPRRRYRHEWLMWIVLLVLAAAFIATQTLAVDSLHNMEATTPQASASVNLRLLGQYAVAVKTLFSLTAMIEPTTTIDQLTRSLNRAVHNPVDAIRAVPILGELKGAGAALRRIAALEHDSKLNAADRQDLAALHIIYEKGPAALSAAQRHRLVQRHGWFARLALTYGLPDSNPQRHAILAGCKRTMAIMAVTSLGGLLLAVAGLALLIVALVLKLTGRLRSTFSHDNLHDPAATQPFLETVVVFLVAVAVLNIAGVLLRLWTGRDFLAITAWFVPLVLLWPSVRGVRWADVRRNFGWHTGRGIGREIGAGLLGYLAGLPLLVVGALVTMVLARYEHMTPEHPVVEQIAHAGAWQLFGIFLLLCVWAPLVEESIFRGALFAHLRQRWSAVLSALFSGLLFASLHPQGWIALPPLLALGFTFALIREWRGSILPSAAAHALNNGIVFLLLVTML